MAAVPSASSFTLRPAEAADFDAYIDAFEAVAAEGRWLGAEAPVDREARRATFDRAVAGDGSAVWVADAGGVIVGAVYAGVSAGVVDLGMFVLQGHRGGGIGSALLEAVIDWARRQGAHKISLAAWPTNHPAIGLYARYGFRIEGTRRRHWRRRTGALWDAVLMGLILDEDSAGGPGPVTPERLPIVVPGGGLRGDGVVLRAWHRADGPPLVALLDDDDEIRRWLPIIPQPYTLADAEEYIAGTRVATTDGTAVRLAVVADGHLAGSVDLRLGTVRTAQIGYWVAAGFRGRGLATAATRLLCDFGFKRLDLDRIELNAEVANTASRRVAERAGFELEGVRRAWQIVHGAPTDFALYGRLADPA